MSQNVDLISEINDLRREIKMLQDEEEYKALQAKQIDRSEEELDEDIEMNENELIELRERI